MNEKCNDYLEILKEELVNKIQPVLAGSPSKEELMNAIKYSLLDWECEISGLAGKKWISAEDVRLLADV
eukprot:7421162-Ditylum_brightwellii.AAC.1